jgi:hypothetical protein
VGQVIINILLISRTRAFAFFFNRAQSTSLSDTAVRKSCKSVICRCTSCMQHVPHFTAREQKKYLRVTASSLDSGATARQFTVTARQYTVTAREYTVTGSSPHSPVRFNKKQKEVGGGTCAGSCASQKGGRHLLTATIATIILPHVVRTNGFTVASEKFRRC